MLQRCRTKSDIGGGSPKRLYDLYWGGHDQNSAQSAFGWRVGAEPGGGARGLLGDGVCVRSDMPVNEIVASP